MSVNIVFIAIREIQVVKTGVFDVQKTTFPVWQTPTEVTLNIVRADDPAAEYKAWVMENKDCVFVQDVFAEDDFLCDNPIGTETVDMRTEHLADFDAWVEEMSQNGWIVGAEAV